jgi:hypothetical protein
MVLQDYPKAEFHYESAIASLRQEPPSERASKQMIMLYGKILSITPDHREAHSALAQEYVAVGQKEKLFVFCYHRPNERLTMKTMPWHCSVIVNSLI